MRIYLTRERACPVCAYPMDGLEPEQDSCTVCSECGAAWRADRWTTDAGIYRPPAVSKSGQGSSKGLLTIKDARGVWVPLLAESPKRDRQDRIMALHDRAAGVIRRRHFAGVMIWFGATAAVAAVMIFITKPGSLVEFSLSFFTLAFVSTVLFIATVLATRASDFQVLKPVLVREMAARGRCPCCESSLRPTPSVIDGSRLCDTCGCAWECTDPPDALGPP